MWMVLENRWILGNYSISFLICLQDCIWLFLALWYSIVIHFTLFFNRHTSIKSAVVSLSSNRKHRKTSHLPQNVPYAHQSLANATSVVAIESERSPESKRREKESAATPFGVCVLCVCVWGETGHQPSALAVSPGLSLRHRGGCVVKNFPFQAVLVEFDWRATSC